MREERLGALAVINIENEMISYDVELINKVVIPKRFVEHWYV